MLDPFVNDIQWSSDKFPLQKVVELFQLPQVVKCHQTTPADSKSIFNDGEILVLNSVRSSKVVRASDSLKNEYYIPMWSSSKVEVIWRQYKHFYDDIEELFEDFPAHVAVEEDDKKLGIKRGDVLKLERKISSKDCSWLQCTLLESQEVLNIPFTYKGVFKTLGGFTQKQVLLRKAAENGPLPLVVKFVDNKLKMKRADGSSRFPIAFFNIDNVTLHEVIDYTDVIASKLLPDATTGTIAIPLEFQDFEFYVPIAKTRSCEKYKQFCDKFVVSTTITMAKTIGIQHNNWIVFQVQETHPPQGSKRDKEKKPHPGLCTLPRPDTSQQPLSDSTDGLTSVRENRSGQRKNSNTFPRMQVIRATQPDLGSDPMYASIQMGKINQNESQESACSQSVDRFYEHIKIEEEEAKYMTMKRNVLIPELKKQFESAGTVSPKRSADMNYENWEYHFSKGRPVAAKKDQLKKRPVLPPPRVGPGPEKPPPLPPKSFVAGNSKVDKSSLDPECEPQHNPSSRQSSDTKFFEKYVGDWSTQDVKKFLEAIGLKKYAKNFKDKKVDGKVLIALNEPVLINSFHMSNKKHLETFLKFRGQCLEHDRFTVGNVYESFP